MITSWDPGKTTGWAAWTDEGTILDMGMCDLEDIAETWAELETEHGATTVAVVEDFRLFRKRAMQQSGSDMPASQGIGMIKALAHGNTEVVMQAPNIKPIAQKFTQIRMPSNHDDTHSIDAYLHGFYYLKDKGLVKSALQLQKERQNG